MILSSLHFSAISFYVLLIIALGLTIFLGIFNFKFIKSPLQNKNYKAHFLHTGLIALGAVIAFCGMMLSIYFYSGIYKVAHASDYVVGLIGAFIFYSSCLMFLETFILHYYDVNKEKKLDKILYYIMISMIPTMLIFLFVMSDGYASIISYPLVNGFSFKEGFVNPENGKPSIAFYALFILSGAVFVYFLCDHKFYVQYGKHGILESTFLIAFPAGILGARIFYVIGNWNVEFANEPFYKVFMINEGGLTILGGAIMGIVVGVSWFMWRNKQYSIWVAVDIIVPTILLAQAIGRWGNFFNCEVHGALTSDSGWRWLPKIILENSRYSSSHGFAPEGQIYVPLFLIESIINVAGYFFLSEVITKLLRKYTCLGDAAFGYVAWYGATRTFMEPLRDGSYNMGTDGYWSWIWSMVFIAAGIFLIMINHIVRYLVKRKKNKIMFNKSHLVRNSIFSSSFLLLGLITSIIGIILMVENVQPLKLAFNAFNIGLIVLVFGISFIFIACIEIPYFIDTLKNKKIEAHNA